MATNTSPVKFLMLPAILLVVDIAVVPWSLTTIFLCLTAFWQTEPCSLEEGYFQREFKTHKKGTAKAGIHGSGGQVPRLHAMHRLTPKRWRVSRKDGGGGGFLTRSWAHSLSCCYFSSRRMKPVEETRWEARGPRGRVPVLCRYHPLVQVPLSNGHMVLGYCSGVTINRKYPHSAHSSFTPKDLPSTDCLVSS